MRINEITQDPELIVQKTDDKETTLLNPINKHKIIVPKDPNKPGTITADPDKEGQFVMGKEEGAITPEIKPGSKVKVQSAENK